MVSFDSWPASIVAAAEPGAVTPPTGEAQYSTFCDVGAALFVNVHVTVPLVVMRPIVLLVWLVNHRAPSGPGVIELGAPIDGWAKLVTVPPALCDALSVLLPSLGAALFVTDGVVVVANEPGKSLPRADALSDTSSRKVEIKF